MSFVIGFIGGYVVVIVAFVLYLWCVGDTRFQHLWRRWKQRWFARVRP